MPADWGALRAEKHSNCRTERARMSQFNTQLGRDGTLFKFPSPRPNGLTDRQVESGAPISAPEPHRLKHL
jgi:hypothetical protein